MNPHGDSTRIGRKAEQRVARFLEERGYVIVGSNVRVGRDEIDLVALDGRTVVLVEVRARSRDDFGHPFETLGARKKHRLRRAALRYGQQHGTAEVRIDAASVFDDQIEYIENAVDFTST
jgi:putative endonuclease